ncbi:MAG: hypothetical protein SGJ04_01605 [Bacteroidota bacterium]|nr:hypothetical protein [Bacteroidota bacterium]
MTILLNILLFFKPIILGWALLNCDVKEDVMFYKDGSGSTIIELKIRDCHNEFRRHQGWKKKEVFNEKMDSLNKEFNTWLSMQPVTEASTVYDSAHLTITISFRFEDVDKLNTTLLGMTDYDGKRVYNVRNGVISREHIPLFFAQQEHLKGEQPLAKKGFYHSYRVYITLPPGTRKFACKDNPKAMFNHRGMGIIIEEDMQKIAVSEGLMATIKYDTY